MSDLCCNASGLIRQHNLRLTRGREAVLEYLLREHHPKSAQDILSDLDTQLSIDQATVYRILHTFEEEHLVYKVTERAGVAYYEARCEHDETHSHFVCLKCGAVSCLDKEIALPENFAPGYQIKGMSIVLQGQCPDCRVKS